MKVQTTFNIMYYSKVNEINVMKPHKCHSKISDKSTCISMDVSIEATSNDIFQGGLYYAGKLAKYSVLWLVRTILGQQMCKTKTDQLIGTLFI